MSTYQLQIRPLSSRAQGFRPRTEDEENADILEQDNIQNDDDSSDDELLPLIIADGSNHDNS